MAHRGPNRLIKEKSPYLLQHANNPVDWFPWGEEAFQKAKEKDLPIFLSIGYFSCHWCHVLEKESFENEEIAKIMNENFINIKVDREERPDIDRVYMMVVQAITGHGGWPLSVWLTPDLKPFFGGTYFPPQDNYGKLGFKSVLQLISKKWKEERATLVSSSEDIIGMIKTAQGSSSENVLNENVLKRCYAQLKDTFDETHAGFSSAPKFPSVPNLNFLLRYYALEVERVPSEAELLSLTEREIISKLNNHGINIPINHEKGELTGIYQSFIKNKNESAEDALNMCLKTLRAMAKGGIHDHISQGFHRYSTDRIWHIPHFEKMLYDQAQLAIVYMEAYQITGDDYFAEIAADILSYVERDLSDPEGGFYCAEDADSKPTLDSMEAVEGAFYVWTMKELNLLLGKDAELFCFHFGVKENGNAPISSEIQGKDVLIEKHELNDTASHFNLSETEATTIIQNCKRKLFEERNKRPRPNLDDKIVTSWNGLMISAFCKGYQILKVEKYRDKAIRAAEFFERHMYDKENHSLLRSYRQGPSGIQGFADDYSYFIQGLLDLYEATFDERFLTWASHLQKTQDLLFWDASSAGYFGSTESDRNIILRMKDEEDGSEPSSNSVSALNLFRLSNFLDNSEMNQKVDALMNSFSQRLIQFPSSVTFLASVFLFLLKSCVQIVIVGSKKEAETQALIEVALSVYIPNKVLVAIDPEEKGPLVQENSSLASKEMLHGLPTAHICRNFVCEMPTNLPNVFKERLLAL